MEATSPWILSAFLSVFTAGSKAFEFIFLFSGNSYCCFLAEKYSDLLKNVVVNMS